MCDPYPYVILSIHTCILLLNAISESIVLSALAYLAKRKF